MPKASSTANQPQAELSSSSVTSVDVQSTSQKDTVLTFVSAGCVCTFLIGVTSRPVSSFTSRITPASSVKSSRSQRPWGGAHNPFICSRASSSSKSFPFVFRTRATTPCELKSIGIIITAARLTFVAIRQKGSRPIMFFYYLNYYLMGKRYKAIPVARSHNTTRATGIAGEV